MASLNIYQIKSGVTDHDEILKERDRLRSYPVRVGRSLLGILYLQRTRLRLPRWLPFFEDAVDFENVELRTAAVAAVLLVQRTERVFVLAFGHGRWLINDGVVEPRFGLRVTLNAIDPASIRSIDHKRLEAVSRHTREQLSRASGLQYLTSRSMAETSAGPSPGTRWPGSPRRTYPAWFLPDVGRGRAYRAQHSRAARLPSRQAAPQCRAALCRRPRRRLPRA